MKTHDQVVKKLMRRPGVRIEVERLEREESALLDALLKARQEAGLSQAEVASRIGYAGAIGGSFGAGAGHRQAFAFGGDVAQVCQSLRQASGSGRGLSLPPHDPQLLVNRSYLCPYPRPRCATRLLRRVFCVYASIRMT